MKEELLTTWAKFREAVQPVSINRIGLRYINRVLRQFEDEKPGHWLKETPLIPAALLDSAAGFAHRLELRTNANNRTLITVAHVHGPDAGLYGALVLDVDRIAEVEMGTDDAELGAAVEALHEDVWCIFADAKNDNYDRLLNGD
jgi:uncharacterized protein (TIGR04255 family)